MVLYGLICFSDSLLGLVVIGLAVCDLFSLFAAKFVAILNLV
jgi:hypothetical protein